MSAQDNGGPAFPDQKPRYSVDGYKTNDFEPVPGMKLRDYFAAKAMTALLPLCSNDARDEGLSFPEHIAAVSYGMADAMLKTRQTDHAADGVRLEERIAELTEIERLDDARIADLERVVRAVPPCPLHGNLCIPHALEWIEEHTPKAGHG